MSKTGSLFKVTTYGESHGISVGAIVENFPSNIKVNTEYIQKQLDRRKPGKSSINTPRKENDVVEIHSGLESGISLGTPILLLIKNLDIKPKDYKESLFIPRPGHADLTYLKKYGVKSSSGGGRSSARETAARVAAGALADSYLMEKLNVNVFAFVKSVNNISISEQFYKDIIYNKTSKNNRLYSKDLIDELGEYDIFKLDYEVLLDKSSDLTSLNSNKNKKFCNKCSEFLKSHLNIFLLYNKSSDTMFISSYIYNLNNSLEFLNSNKEIFDFCCINFFNINLVKRIDFSGYFLQELKNKFDYTEKYLSEDKRIITMVYKESLNEDELDHTINSVHIKFDYLETTNIRCPEISKGAEIIIKILKTKSENDSLGGVITCVIQNIPESLGEPCFDKLEAEIAKAMLSIPSTKGFEIGSGFEGTKLSGKEHNDMFTTNLKENIIINDCSNKLSLFKSDLIPKTNNAGGTLGGISSGSPLYFNIAFKPVSTIGIDQFTMNINGEDTILKNKGRHDPCVLNRAIPIVESMASLVLMDLVLIQNSRIWSEENKNENNIDLLLNES